MLCWPAEEREPLFAGASRKSLESGPGGGDGPVEVLFGAERNLRERLLRRRVDDIERRRDRGIQPAPADVELRVTICGRRSESALVRRRAENWHKFCGEL